MRKKEVVHHHIHPTSPNKKRAKVCHSLIVYPGWAINSADAYYTSPPALLGLLSCLSGGQQQQQQGRLWLLGRGAEPRHSHPFLKPESHRRCSSFTFLLRTASFREPLRRADHPSLLLFERGEEIVFLSAAVRQP